MSQEKRVFRFAPSPTGNLHIGGARTAVVNWLLARHYDGVFLLRIEDTDTRRSREEYVEQIIGDLNWLGLDRDAPIVRQSTRTQEYLNAAKSLLDSGHAYRCFCTPEDIERKRGEKPRETRDWIYDRTCLGLDSNDVQARLDNKHPYCVRFRIPDGFLSWKDLLRKKTRLRLDTLDDFVLLRSDTTPTYHLTVVVDDLYYGITDVVRGEDHITNTPKQILLFNALGARVPSYLHLPLVLGSDGKPLSKRHGDTSVGHYRGLGFLPNAVVNHLALLGWSPPGSHDILQRDQLIQLFDDTRFNKSAGVFDEERLRWINSRHLRLLPDEKIFVFLYPDGVSSDAKKADSLERIRIFKSRAKTLQDFHTSGDYLFLDDFSTTPEAAEILSNTALPAIIKKFVKTLEPLEDFQQKPLEELIRAFANNEGIKAKDIIHPLRAVLTGKTVSPGIFELMEILGRDVCLSRLNKFLQV